MAEKIVNLNPNKLHWRTLLHQTLEREGVEAVVMVIKINDAWHTAWGAESNASLAMASVKLTYDVMNWIHDEDNGDD